MHPQTFNSQDFDDFIRDLLTAWHVPGLAIAVVNGDKTFCKSFGHARFPDQKVDENTLFDCASTSKSFTAAAVALLVESHQNTSKPSLQWTTPVHDILPEDFEMSNPEYTKKVAIEDILSHRSGLPSHDASYMGVNSKAPDSARSITRNLRNLPVNEPIATKYQYCNMMYTVATHVVEEISQRPFGPFLEQNLWAPLGMERTYLDLAGVEAHNAEDHLARGYSWAEEKKQYKELPLFRQPEGQGAGSIFSTVSDYAIWIRCMMKQSSPLSPESHKELIKPRIIVSPEQKQDMTERFFSHELYALGWVIKTYRGQKVVGHDGCVWGFASCMKYLPLLDWGIVIFSNGNKGANEMIESIVMHLIDEVLEVPMHQRVDWPQLAKNEYENDVLKEKEDERAEYEAFAGEEPSLPLPLPIEQYVGTYFNKGYHELRFGIKDGERLWADCSDRAFPFYLSLEHVSGDKFWARLENTLDGESEGIKGVFMLNGDRVERVGLAIEEEMADEMIWFDKMES